MNLRQRIFLSCWLLLFMLLLLPLPLAAQTAQGPIQQVEVQGVISSVTVGYLQRALQIAETSQSSALIITLSNSGGVLRDVRPFATQLAQAKIPVVVYVTPSGVQSGASGALFLSAAHISVMAPGTSFGSAYPLAQVNETLSQQSQDLVLDSVTNQLRGWNAAHGRNTAWIDQAVREGAILNNEQAIALVPPAIDLVAANQQDLLTLLDGRQVTMADGSTRQITTLGRTPTLIAPTFWEQLRLLLTDPNIAFILLFLGAIAIYLEIAAPGTTIFAGIGIVLLAGAILGLSALPLVWWAALLVLLSFVLAGLELVTPVSGALVTVGLAMLTIGGLNLVDPIQAPGVGISYWTILIVALAIGMTVALSLWLILRSRRQPIVTGQDALIGQLAEVRQRLDPEGMVFLEGALWQAISEDGTIEVRDWVRVVGRHQLRLIVRSLVAEEPSLAAETSTEKP